MVLPFELFLHHLDDDIIFVDIRIGLAALLQAAEKDLVWKRATIRVRMNASKLDE